MLLLQHFWSIIPPSKLKKIHCVFGYMLCSHLLNPYIYFNGNLIHIVQIIGIRLIRSNVEKKLQSSNFLYVLV